jgi:hypothetical protein
VALRTLAAAFLLSLLVPVGEALLPLAPPARGSLAALALLPWLALATLPEARRDAAPSWRSGSIPACLALPPICLGAGVDLARGAEAHVLGASAAAGWLVLLLWSLAAELARRAPAASSVFAALWFVLLPGASALALALTWVPLRAGSAAPRRAVLLAADPLLWCHRWGRAEGLAELRLGELALAVSTAVLVLGVVLALGRRASAEDAA